MHVAFIMSTLLVNPLTASSLPIASISTENLQISCQVSFITLHKKGIFFVGNAPADFSHQSRVIQFAKNENVLLWVRLVRTRLVASNTTGRWQHLKTGSTEMLKKKVNLKVKIVGIGVLMKNCVAAQKSYFL